ncbi:MAG: 50S ribosomal protein L27 [Parcubacteria group bacterium]|nr:50S ribosomal protein L27 [Parcubacteria group bacterium]MCR4342633.1 50S ribosomal protein L27 [Patescibacteria group bacterium]
MAHKKAGGSAKNLTDSKPKYLGVKLYDGQTAKAGSILVRQRGTNFTAGANTKVSKDHTIFALKEGTVKYSSKKKQNFDGTSKQVKVVNIV